MFDVTSQWMMLFALIGYHFVVVLCGLIFYSKEGNQEEKLFEEINEKGELFFLSLHQIGLVSGVIGCLGVIISITGMIAPLRYANQLILLNTFLAIFPLFLFGIFWLIKMRKISIKHWIDERQAVDSAEASTISLVLSIPIYFLVLLFGGLGFKFITVQFSVILIMFIQISVFSFVVLVKNGFGYDR